MSSLPASGYISNAARTNAEQKLALEELRDAIAELEGGSARSELTISAGAVVPPDGSGGGHHTLDTEGNAASDDLTNVTTTNTPEGRILTLWMENTARVVTIKNAFGGAGQITLRNSTDFVFVALTDWIKIQRRGTDWVEIDRSARGGAVVIATGTVSAAATLDVTGLSSAYRAYQLVFDGLLPATDSVELFLRLSDDAGVSYEADASDYAWALGSDTEAAATSNTGDDADSEISMGPGYGNVSSEVCAGEIWLFNPADAGYTQVMFRLARQSQAPVFVTHHGGGQLQAAGATTAFRLLFSSGNIAAMNYTLYGYTAV